MGTAEHAEVRMVETRDGFIRIEHKGKCLALWPQRFIEGLTRSEIMERVKAVNAAREEINRKAEELIAAHPGLGFGYVGNSTSTFDDRIYMFFLPHPGRVGTFADRFGRYRPWELDQMLADWPKLEATVAKRMNGPP